jgi:hypothetical protein
LVNFPVWVYIFGPRKIWQPWTTLRRKVLCETSADDEFSDSKSMKIERKIKIKLLESFFAPVQSEKLCFNRSQSLRFHQRFLQVTQCEISNDRPYRLLLYIPT